MTEVKFEVRSCESLSRTNSITENLLQINLVCLFILIVPDISLKHDCKILCCCALLLLCLLLLVSKEIAFSNSVLKPQHSLIAMSCILKTYAQYILNWTRFNRRMYCMNCMQCMAKNSGSVVTFPSFRAYLASSRSCFTKIYSLTSWCISFLSVT